MRGSPQDKGTGLGETWILAGGGVFPASSDNIFLSLFILTTTMRGTIIVPISQMRKPNLGL